MVTVHEVRFKGREHHGIRAFCTCGWHADAASGQTLTELTALVKRHDVAVVTVKQASRRQANEQPITID